MRYALTLLALILTTGCQQVSTLRSGQYVAEATEPDISGAVIRIDTESHEIWAVGGCSASGLDYVIEGETLKIVGATATADGPCPDGAADARNIALANALFEGQPLALSSSHSGFKITPAGGVPITFVPTTAEKSN